MTRSVDARRIESGSRIGRGLADTLLGCGGLLAVFLVGFGLFIGWDYLDRMKYNRVSAHIETIRETCLLQWDPPRDPVTVEESRPRRGPEVDCALARNEAPRAHAHVIERRTVTYTYRSPVNGRTYGGRLNRDADDFPRDIRIGGEMPVYSLKSDPGRSRGIYQWPVD